MLRTYIFCKQAPSLLFSQTPNSIDRQTGLSVHGVYRSPARPVSFRCPNNRQKHFLLKKPFLFWQGKMACLTWIDNVYKIWLDQRTAIRTDRPASNLSLDGCLMSGIK